MTIQVGERLPEGTLYESTEFDPATSCPMKPQTLDVPEAAKGKKIVLFAVPGAYTPLCSAQHLPGYVAHFDGFKAKGVDEIWCLAVNDAFVMASWGRDLGASGKVRMMADGSAEYVTKLGLDMDLVAKGMGVRSQRFAAIIDDGVVTHLGVEAPSKFEVSNAEAILAQL
jgi:peroxiredoxin